MSDSVLDRFSMKLAGETDQQPEESTDDFDAFGWLRGVRDRATMLELRHRDGSSTAFGYTWLEKAEFDPSEGITLQFAGKKVRILGRNLNKETRPQVRLYRGILRQRVPWIQEADGATVMEAGPDRVLVERFELK